MFKLFRLYRLYRRRAVSVILTLIMTAICLDVVLPIPVSGKVKQITDTENKLEGITDEEKEVLKELFSLNQKIEALVLDEERISKDIDKLKLQISDMQEQIDAKKEAYDTQLGVLKQVLVNYQRGGPATYLEILLKAKDLSGFLQSINVLKDISHNVKKLLSTLNEQKKALEEQKAKLDDKMNELAAKKSELGQTIEKNKTLQEEKEAYLNSLKENKDYYEEQLNNLELIWTDCKALFPKLASKITGTINGGYFTIDDLNMEYGLTKMSGYLKQEDFNQIFQDEEDLTQISFEFRNNQVILKVPKEHLVLYGNFHISGDNAIRYDVTEGTFYDLPLEEASIKELFDHGPLVIDFKAISEGIISIDFTLTKVRSEDGSLTFEIKPIW